MRIAERWEDLYLKVTLRHATTITQVAREALTALPDPGFGGQVTIGVAAFPTVVGWSTAQMRALATELTGEVDHVDETAQATVGPLTVVEQSMAGLLLREFVLAVGDAWPGAASLECALAELFVRPRRTRLFTPEQTLVVTRIHVQSLSRSDEMVWLLPQEELEDLIDRECVPATHVRGTPHPALQKLIRHVPVPLKVELGRTRLSMAEMATLQSGDVLVLEQPVDRLLVADVGGEMKFRGRPGRVGTRQSLQIEDVIDDGQLGRTI